MTAIYSDKISQEELRTKLRDLTRDTKASHNVFDMRYPAWGLGLHGFEPIAESENVVAKAMITVPPGEKVSNGDVMVLPTKGRPTIAMIFDPKPMPGDWIGDAYEVHAVQQNLQQAIGHEFVEKGQDTGRGR